jgi:hypothetical protein
MPRFNDNGCRCGHCCCDDCSCVTNHGCKCDVCGWNGNHNGELWPEEERSLEKLLSDPDWQSKLVELK